MRIREEEYRARGLPAPGNPRAGEMEALEDLGYVMGEGHPMWEREVYNVGLLGYSYAQDTADEERSKDGEDGRNEDMVNKGGTTNLI